MTMLIAPTERDLKPLLDSKAIVSSLPEKRGADILVAVTSKGCLAIQRKAFPSDLFASLQDGRLARELPLLSQTEYPVLLIEGEPAWTADEHLMHLRYNHWTKTGYRNLKRSVWVQHGVAVEETANINSTVERISELEAYFRQDIHRSLNTRHKPVLRDSWGQPERRHRGTRMLDFFYQGIEGVGVTLADELVRRYPAPVDLCQASLEDLLTVPSIGAKRAQTIYRFLRER